MTDLERARLAVARAEVRSIAAAALAGDLTAESLGAGLEALRQVPLDASRVLDAVHLPGDAGDHAAALERILRRIPDGWGRWIDCDAGWYPIIARLDAAIADLVPAYEVLQVKEKYGTLRYYVGSPHREPSCCHALRERDPRPFEGAISGPFAPKDRDPEEQRLLEAWYSRYVEHLASDEHRRVRDADHAALDQERIEALNRRVDALIDAAEEESARTCERCGVSGCLRENAGWLKTLCDACASVLGYGSRSH